MKETIKDKVKELLSQGKITGFVGLRQRGQDISPYVFTDPEELEELSLGDRDRPGDARYPLVGLLGDLTERFPTEIFGLLVRGCDERALRVRMADNRVTPLSPDRVIPVGFSCPPELAQACRCHKPWPDALTAGEPTPGVNLAEEPFSGDLLEEMDKWTDILNRCVKCFGCRDICPVCSCRECTVEQEAMVPQRELPPAPSFLMTRAVHMVGRCVYCGLCEQACPADIPLKSLYRLVAAAFGQDAAAPGAVTVPYYTPTGARTGE